MPCRDTGLAHLPSLVSGACEEVLDEAVIAPEPIRGVGFGWQPVYPPRTKCTRASNAPGQRRCGEYALLS